MLSCWFRCQLCESSAQTAKTSTDTHNTHACWCFRRSCNAAIIDVQDYENYIIQAAARATGATVGIVPDVCTADEQPIEQPCNRAGATRDVSSITAQTHMTHTHTHKTKHSCTHTHAKPASGGSDAEIQRRDNIQIMYASEEIQATATMCTHMPPKCKNMSTHMICIPV